MEKWKSLGITKHTPQREAIEEPFIERVIHNIQERFMHSSVVQNSSVFKMTLLWMSQTNLSLSSITTVHVACRQGRCPDGVADLFNINGHKYISVVRSSCQDFSVIITDKNVFFRFLLIVINF